MIKRFIKNYYKLFDEKLNNWSIIVLIIWTMIAWVWNITHSYDSTSITYAKSNVIESKITIKDFIEIDWKTYKLVK